MGSEYGGTGPRRQPVQPKGIAALTAAEKILLLNNGGSIDPYTPPDDMRTWEGVDAHFGDDIPPLRDRVPDPFDDTGSN